MQVAVIRELCKSHGTCCDLAPSLFSLDEEGIAVVADVAIGDELENLVKRAVFSCPEGAIIVQ